jgi:glycosyltransferase involved in cell wall biosynthesis
MEGRRSSCSLVFSRRIFLSALESTSRDPFAECSRVVQARSSKRTERGRFRYDPQMVSPMEESGPPPRVTVIIPAFNEEASLPLVLEEIPRDLVAEVIVVDNASTDATARVAREGGARVVREERRGYGAACLRGITALGATDIVAFLDADHSDFPEDLRRVIAPIAAGEADFVIGSRTLGGAEQGSLAPQVRFGNWISATLLYWLYGHRFSDLGPLRALRAKALLELGLEDPTFGWNVEMQIQAIRRGLRIGEVPVRYRKRIGVSKISGTFGGTVKAGTKILYTIFKYALRRSRKGRELEAEAAHRAGRRGEERELPAGRS